MDDQKPEDRLERLLKQDLSAGTEVFRGELLARCLTVLNSESADGGSLDAAVLDDSVLDLLSAAGDFSVLDDKRFSQS